MARNDLKNAMPWEASEEKPTAPSTVITYKGHFGASTVSRVAPDDGRRNVAVSRQQDKAAATNGTFPSPICTWLRARKLQKD